MKLIIWSFVLALIVALVYLSSRDPTGGSTEVATILKVVT